MQMINNDVKKRKTRNTFLTYDWYQPIKQKGIYPTPKYVIQQALKMVTETTCITLLNLCELKPWILQRSTKFSDWESFTC